MYIRASTRAATCRATNGGEDIDGKGGTGR